MIKKQQNEDKISTFDRDYAIKELLHLRELMGKRSFWIREGNPVAALTGFIHMWLRTRGLLKEDQISFEATLIEFEKRNYLVAKNILEI